jgi:hypothetical protein
LAQNPQPQKGVTVSTFITVVFLILIIFIFTVDFLTCPNCDNNVATRVVDSYCSFDGHVTVFEYLMYDFYLGVMIVLSTYING